MVQLVQREAFPVANGRQPSKREQSTLDALSLTDAQFNWVLAQYVESTPYPHVRDFVAFEAEFDVPEDILCRADTSGHPALESLVEEMQELQAVWFPDGRTAVRIEEIRSILEGALD